MEHNRPWINYYFHAVTFVITALEGFLFALMAFAPTGAGAISLSNLAFAFAIAATRRASAFSARTNLSIALLSRRRATDSAMDALSAFTASRFWFKVKPLTVSQGKV